MLPLKILRKKTITCINEYFVILDSKPINEECVGSTISNFSCSEYDQDVLSNTLMDWKLNRSDQVIFRTYFVQHHITYIL